jgi:DNA-binding beta-propeller fold protein YncE
MSRRGLMLAGALLLGGLAGCATPPGPIFPTVTPPRVWPPPPDTPRIEYVGALVGETSLSVPATGWAAFQELVGGPRMKSDFSRPSAVAVRGARVYVADVGLGVVHLLDLDTRHYLGIRGNPADPMQVPIDLALTPRGLVVADRKRAVLETLDFDGRYVSSQRWPEITAPTGLAWDAAHDRLWVADAGAHACFALNLASGAIVQRLGGRGAGPGQFNYPSAIAADAQGVVVVDAMNFRVQTFDAAGTPLRAFGQKGDAAGDFARPRAVALDAAGRVYVVDNQFENVQLFDRSGQLLMALGHNGAAPGEFALPAGLTIDAEGRLWVADSYNHRVQVFQLLAESGS